MISTSTQPLRPTLALRAVRFAGKAAAVGAASIAALAIVGAFSLEAFDRLGDSTPEFAWGQLKAEIRGDRTPIEREAMALLSDIRSELRLPALALVRVGLAEDLGSMDYAARFNPTTFRLAISPGLANAPPEARRAILLHELGHAVAFASGASPNLALADPQASEILRRSLLSNQIFHESFADAFAVAWAMRINPADRRAWSDLAYAVASPRAHSSPAHETAFALRLLRLRLSQARSVDIQALPALLAGIASQGAAQTIASMGAEREAACAMGARAITRYALDWGYESFYLPWEMAQTFPISPNDPMASGLESLARLRRPGASLANPWSTALDGARPAIEASLAAARSGASPDQAASVAGSGFAMSRQNPLPRDVDAVAFASRLVASSRTGWRASLADFAVSASDKLLPAPTYGCRAIAATPVALTR